MYGRELISLQSKLTEIIGYVLKLLTGLAQDIVGLLDYFKILNTEIKKLVEEHEEASKTIEDIQDDMAEGVEINRPSYASFKKHIVLMKKTALTVNALSNLYSSVITDIINPGFARAIENSQGDMSGTSTALIFAKQSGMNTYIQQAENMCRTKSIEANRRLKMRLEETDNTAVNQSTGRKKSKRQFAEPVPPNSTTERRGSRFSRFNPFRR
jgi:hypothetical protein